MRGLTIGDEVFVRRTGVLPDWFVYQGLPGTVTSIVPPEYNVQLANGRLVAFLADELVLEWSPISDSDREATPKAPDYPTDHPETIGLQAEGPKPLDRASEGSEAPACSICEHAAEHHWFGLSSGTTHCHGCHSTWSGANAQHCVRCHRTFGSPGAANAHLRRGDCVDPGRRKTNAGTPYFGEPVINEWGTSIWRTAPRENAPWNQEAT